MKTSPHLMLLALVCAGCGASPGLQAAIAAAEVVRTGEVDSDAARHAALAVSALRAYQTASDAGDVAQVAAAAPCAADALDAFAPDVQDRPALASAIEAARALLASYGGVCASR